jgi:hypothetical protein
MFQAPKWNHNQARKQINSIEKLLFRVDATLISLTESHLPRVLSASEGGLKGVESFRDPSKEE